MYTIAADNPDNALRLGVKLLKDFGEEEPSRNGQVLVSPLPVTTIYSEPTRCVSFCQVRDANPFFHLMEALWMLAGRNDVAFPAHYAPRLATFSDDGKTLNGAYGFRWRKHFEHDQLDFIVEELATNPTSRRVVLSMWDPSDDLHAGSRGVKDVPCNTQAYFRRRGDVLDMTVTCRSNDIIWGAYGANVVHFSLLLQYMAARIGVGVGTYYQLSNNYHAYIERDDTKKLFERGALNYPTTGYGPTVCSLALTVPAMVSDLDQELTLFVGSAISGAAFMRWENRFLELVAKPMARAFAAYKEDDLPLASSFLEGSPFDWHVAGAAWLKRRLEKRTQTQEVR